MTVSVKIVSMPSAMAKLRERGPQIIAALAQKLTALMIELAGKIVGESIPAKFPRGAPNIAATVQAQPAELQGTKLVAGVGFGGPRTTKRTLMNSQVVDYAAVQEYGSRAHEILPFDKKALRFELDGKIVFAKRVFHPGTKELRYMRDPLLAMADEIERGLQQTFIKELNAP